MLAQRRSLPRRLKAAEGGRQGKPPEDAPPVEEKIAPDRRRTEREEKQRRRRNRTSQGLMRKFRKLQGPLGKVNFSLI
jgi:hypothetical protein